jgi:hypothetical protein
LILFVAQRALASTPTQGTTFGRRLACASYCATHPRHDSIVDWRVGGGITIRA